jgi:hypothetical protein
MIKVLVAKPGEPAYVELSYDTIEYFREVVRVQRKDGIKREHPRSSRDADEYDVSDVKGMHVLTKMKAVRAKKKLSTGKVKTITVPFTKIGFHAAKEKAMRFLEAVDEDVI